MSQSIPKAGFRCEAVDASPTRRALLVGLGAGGPLLALMATRGPSLNRQPRAGALRVGDLAGPDGSASDLARAMAGQRVAIAGYPAPALRAGVAFDLYERSTAPCLSCGLIHDPGASVAVVGANAPPASPLAPKDIAGRLEIDPRGLPRLIIA